MRYRKLKRTGLETSVLACGSHIAEHHVPYMSQGECNVAYNYALDKGINTIAINASYRTAEDKLYKAVGHRRDEFNLSVGTDYRAARLAEKDIHNSLKKFNTDHIEIYQMSGIRRVDAVSRALRSDGALQALRKAKKEGKIGHIGVAGHNIEALVKAIKTGHVECCQFVLNMVQREALEELIPIAKEYDVDLFVMRPLDDRWYSGQVYKALRFVFSSPADVVISGMYSKDIIDANIAIAEAEPSEDEWRTLLKEAEAIQIPQCHGCMLCRGHWNDWDGWACPQKIDIYDLLVVWNFRKKYGLSPAQEERYRAAVEKIKDCDECLRCESLCIFNIPIIQLLHEIESELK